MHYYTFRIGDYRRDTAHLNLLEHGIYRQLIDTYYLSEKPLCADLATLMRTHCIRTEEEERSLKNVLHDFFQLEDDGWHHTGCDRLIQQYKEKSEKARASATARWSNASAMRTHTERNADAMLTNNQEPITNKKTERRQAAPPCPSDVSEQVWSDFLAVRKAKRSPVTETALKAINQEAEKAGWNLEKALRECVSRGWIGFKADWVKNKDQNLSFRERDELAARQKWEEMTGQQTPQTFDLGVFKPGKLLK